jgi:hypothetical protein
MAQKKSNKKKKKTVADLVLEHHFNNKSDIVDVESESENEVEESVQNNAEDKKATETFARKKNKTGKNHKKNIPTTEEIDTDIDDLAEDKEENNTEKENIDIEETEESNLSDEENIQEPNFIETTTEELAKIEEKNEHNSEEAVEELQAFLKRVDKRVDRIAKVQAQREDDIDIVGDEYQFKKIKKEMTYFQNELEEGLNEKFGDLGETVATVISELKNSLSDVQDYLEQDNKKYLKNIIHNVKVLKEDVANVSNDIKSIDKQAIYDTEKTSKYIVELTTKAKAEIDVQLEELKKLTAKGTVLDAYQRDFDKTNKENIELFKTTSSESLAILRDELTQVRNNLHAQIREVLRKIAIQDEIKFLCEEISNETKSNSTEISVLRKYLKNLQIGEERQEELLDEIKVFIQELTDFEMNESADKVDIIYENISMLNEWASKSDEVAENLDNFHTEFNEHKENVNTIGNNIVELNTWSDKISENFEDLRADFELNSDKVDIIYENLSFINEWVQTFEKFVQDIDDIKSDFERDEKLTEKIDSLYTNINAIKDWSKKADALGLQVRALSVQISETESTINSQNLADIKELFTQMSEDMSNLSSRTNKMILDTDKTNDTMKNHLTSLNSIIQELNDVAHSDEMKHLQTNVEEIKSISKNNTDFSNTLIEAFSYLAEWIDSAGISINKIQTDLNDVHFNQESQVEQITNQYKEQIEKLEELNNVVELIKNSVNIEDKDTIVKVEEIIKQNNSDIQEAIIEQNNLLKQAFEEQNTQIKNLLQIQETQAETIKNLQNQIDEILHGKEENNQLKLNQIEDSLLDKINNIEEITADCKNDMETLSKNSSTITENVEQIQISGEKLFEDVQEILQQQQETVETFISNNKDKEETLYSKMELIADYISKQDEIPKIYESFEQRISAIKPDNSEIKNLLDFIASQVVSTNENSLKSDILARKIESMETKLSSLEQYMARLIEYIDEDE